MLLEPHKKTTLHSWPFNGGLAREGPRGMSERSRMLRDPAGGGRCWWRPPLDFSDVHHQLGHVHVQKGLYRFVWT